MPYAKVKAQRSAMVGRGQLGSREWGRLRRSLQHEMERGDGREKWKKDEGSFRKTAKGAGIYTWEKAAGEAMPGALPEEATLNLTGWRLAGRGGISPRRSLWDNIAFSS